MRALPVVVLDVLVGGGSYLLEIPPPGVVDELLLQRAEEALDHGVVVAVAAAAHADPDSALLEQAPVAVAGVLAPTDEDGRFTFAGEAGESQSPLAIDRSTGARSEFVNARCGGPEVELHLVPPPRIELLVTHLQGEPIPHFQFRAAYGTDGPEPVWSSPLAPHPGGRIEVHNDGRALQFTVEVEGYEPRTLPALSFSARPYGLGSAESTLDPLDVYVESWSGIPFHRQIHDRHGRALRLQIFHSLACD